MKRYLPTLLFLFSSCLAMQQTNKQPRKNPLLEHLVRSFSEHLLYNDKSQAELLGKIDFLKNHYLNSKPSFFEKLIPDFFVYQNHSNPIPLLEEDLDIQKKKFPNSIKPLQIQLQFYK